MKDQPSKFVGIIYAGRDYYEERLPSGEVVRVEEKTTSKKPERKRRGT